MGSLTSPGVSRAIEARTIHVDVEVRVLVFGIGPHHGSRQDEPAR